MITNRFDKMKRGQIVIDQDKETFLFICDRHHITRTMRKAARPIAQNAARETERIISRLLMSDKNT